MEEEKIELQKSSSVNINSSNSSKKEELLDQIQQRSSSQVEVQAQRLSEQERIRYSMLKQDLDQKNVNSIISVGDVHMLKQRSLILEMIQRDAENQFSLMRHQNQRKAGSMRNKDQVCEGIEEIEDEEKGLTASELLGVQSNQKEISKIELSSAFIKLELVQMGFPSQMVSRLLKYEAVEDVNHGVQLLIKGDDNLWMHKFVQEQKISEEEVLICAICSDTFKDHFDFKRREEEQKLEKLFQDFLENNHGGSIVAPLLRVDSFLEENSFEIRPKRGKKSTKKKFNKGIRRVDPVEEGGNNCEICYMDYKLEDMFGLKCKHYFCFNCVVDYLEFNITNGQVIKIKCPQSQCPNEFTKDEIRQFGSQEIYDKYLRFKEDIDVNMNPNLKWCPRPNCNRYLKKGKKRLVQCECGQRMCFECGLEWHGNQKCADAMDQEYKQWASDSGNVGNCPKCKVRVEKMSGCNHMTCRQCHYEWCWLCGAKYNSFHFNPVNVFGCPGMQNFTVGQHWVFLANIGILILLPLVLLFTPPIFFLIVYFIPDEFGVQWLCCCANDNRNCLTKVILAIFFVPVIFSLGLVLGALALGLLVVPAYFYQIFRIFKIILRRFKCCLK